MRRLRQWKRFSKELTIIRDHQIAENRKSITDSERERLLRYQAPEHPYSLMFRCVLATVSL
jgi:hypothetical protein